MTAAGVRELTPPKAEVRVIERAAENRTFGLMCNVASTPTFATLRDGLAALAARSDRMLTDFYTL